MPTETNWRSSMVIVYQTMVEYVNITHERRSYMQRIVPNNKIKNNTSIIIIEKRNDEVI